MDKTNARTFVSFRINRLPISENETPDSKEKVNIFNKSDSISDTHQTC